jgi:hypothetical protein
MQTAKTLANFFLLFLALLAPLMFLVGVIAGMDQSGAQRRLLKNLQMYGKTIDATVTYIDNEYGRAGVDYVLPNGKQGYGTLDWHYYSPEVRESIRPGTTIRIIYIDALISESEKTVLAEHYDDVKNYPLVPTDIWWILGISWFVIAIRPQFVFLGMTDLNVLMPASLVKQLK